MKTTSLDKSELAGWGVAILATVLLLVMLLGCSSFPIALPPVEVCVDHPTYGQVCLTYEGGKVKLAVEIGSDKVLDEAARSELEAWHAANGGPR